MWLSGRHSESDFFSRQSYMLSLDSSRLGLLEQEINALKDTP